MNDEMDIKAILGPIRRQYRLILTVTLLIVGIAAVVGFSLTPKYEATTLLYVDTGKRSLLGDDVNFSNASTDNTKITSEVEIVKSDGVVLNLVSRLNLISDDELGVKLGRSQKLLAAIGLGNNDLPSGNSALASVIGNVKNSISVSRKGLTYIISVSARSKNAEKASKLANELASAYLETQLISKVGNIEVSLAVVRKQLEETEASVASSQKSLDGFVLDNLNEIAQINNEPDLIKLQNELTSLQDDRLFANSQKSWILKGLGGGVWLSEVSGLKSDALRALEIQRSQITGDISNETISAIALDKLRAQLAKVESGIKAEAATILSSLNENIAVVDNSISDLQSQLTDRIVSGNIQLPDSISTQLYRLSQQSRNTTLQYQALLAKAQELEAERLLQTADARVISPAFVPNSPVSPNIKLILAAACVFAFGLAVGLAFLIENYIGGFVSNEQVEALTGYRVASSIQKVFGQDESTVSERVVTEPLSIFAESIRKLKTGVHIALQNSAGQKIDGKKSGKVIMVSSSVPSEGKTSISLSLARTLAFSGARTLILDCDVRKPSIATRMKFSSEKGLANLFIGEINAQTLARNIELDDKTNLHAILAYRAEMRDVQFTMGFQPFEKIIDVAREHYDYIVLDTPPIGPVADALTLSEFSDIVVFVVKWAKTSQRSVLESLKLIKAMSPNTPIVTVLNQVDENANNSYSQYTGYYSDA